MPKLIKVSLVIPLLLAILVNSCGIYGFDYVVKIPDDNQKKKHKALIILPNNYKYCQKRFPVIYLLHGYGGNHKSWPRIVPLKKYADSLQLIFVCPDGNYDSWYIDSPVRDDYKYESFLKKKMIPFVDSNYRVISSPDGRAICGSSMGGHGALTIICKNPDLFCAASSISGILDLTLFPFSWNIRDVLGSFYENEKLWFEYSFLFILKELSKSRKPILIDCGLSDFALKSNREAHIRLDSLKIEHEYSENPGDHSPAYIKKRFFEHLRFLTRHLQSAY
jgi:S-formylglutathione hydrolase FrmB